MKITFTRNHKPKGHSPSIPHYKQGESYTFEGGVAEGYARKYIRLGYAAEAKDEPKPEPVVEAVVEVEVPEVVFTPKPSKYRR